MNSGSKIILYTGIGALVFSGFIAMGKSDMMSLNGRPLSGEMAQNLSVVEPAAGEGQAVFDGAVSSDDDNVVEDGIQELPDFDDVDPEIILEEYKNNGHDHSHDHHGHHEAEHRHDDFEGEKVNDQTLSELGEDLKDGELFEKDGKTYIKHGDHYHEDVVWEENVFIEDCGRYDQWVNKPLNEEAIIETGKEYRIIRPGDAITKDMRPERVNVYINNNDIVLSVLCG